MKIFLIGYRCTGKSSVGKILAEKLGFKFIDTDHYLQERERQDISYMVSKNGWAYFRDKESEVLNYVSNLPGDIVVSTGGGIIERDSNIEIMKEKGLVIWLKASFETIFSRMGNDTENKSLRPALTDSPLYEEIKETLKRREPMYEYASSYSVDTQRHTVEDVTSIIRSLISNTKRDK